MLLSQSLRSAGRHPRARMFGVFDRWLPDEDAATKQAKATEDKLIRQNMQRSKFAEMFSAQKDKKFVATSAVDAPAADCAWPRVTATDLITGASYDVHDRLQAPGAPLTFVTLAFQGAGQQQLPVWQSAFLEAFKPAPLYDAAPLPRIRMLNLLYLSGLFFRAFSGVMVSSTQRALDPALHPYTAIAFEPSSKAAEVFCHGARIHNRMMAHVMLVDSAGFVRWRAHGIPAPGEVSGLIGASQTLLQHLSR